MVKRNRIIIDTNLWISFLISNNFNQLDEILNTVQCTVLFSQELLEEFIEVSGRPKLTKHFSKSNLINILETIQEFAEFIEITSTVQYLKDSKDDFLLSLALDGKADYLITGDKELLDVKKFSSTEIITMTDFLELYAN